MAERKHLFVAASGVKELLTDDELSADRRCVDEFRSLEIAAGAGQDPSRPPHVAGLKAFVEHAKKLPPLRREHWRLELLRLGVDDPALPAPAPPAKPDPAPAPKAAPAAK